MTHYTSSLGKRIGWAVVGLASVFGCSSEQLDQYTARTPPTPPIETPPRPAPMLEERFTTGEYVVAPELTFLYPQDESTITHYAWHDARRRTVSLHLRGAEQLDIARVVVGLEYEDTLQLTDGFFKTFGPSIITKKALPSELGNYTGFAQVTTTDGTEYWAEVTFQVVK